MSEYVSVYNVTLLDDIHNYFPALLYDQGQFQTVPHVLHYVRSQIHSRFNLFAYGASLHRGTVPTPVASVHAAAQSVDPTPPESGLSVLFSLLSNPNMYPDSPRARTRIVTSDSFFDPVIIRPSAAIIAQNTTIVQAGNLPANDVAICTVCQDSIQGEDECRKLNACNHLFHISCIDQWFETNVRCPTCRHDVRVGRLST
jgi:hypothetical protein